MSDDIAGWEVVSEHVNRHSFWEILVGLFAGLRPPPTITYTVRLKSTAPRTITCFGAGELPERIANGQFDYEFIIPDDDAERVLAGFRVGGEAAKIALDHIELLFRHRLQKGDIDPKDLFTSLQGFAQRGGDPFVRQFSKRCFPLLSKETQVEIKGIAKLPPPPQSASMARPCRSHFVAVLRAGHVQILHNDASRHLRRLLASRQGVLLRQLQSRPWPRRSWHAVRRLCQDLRRVEREIPFQPRAAGRRRS